MWTTTTEATRLPDTIPANQKHSPMILSPVHNWLCKPGLCLAPQVFILLFSAPPLPPLTSSQYPSPLLTHMHKALELSTLQQIGQEAKLLLIAAEWGTQPPQLRHHTINVCWCTVGVCEMSMGKKTNTELPACHTSAGHFNNTIMVQNCLHAIYLQDTSTRL